MRLFVLVITTLLASPAVAQVPDAATKLTSIKGRVLSDGQAVTNASVTVSGVSSPRQSRSVPTNDNGDFEVKGLESGIYRVQVTAPAYVTPPPSDPDEELHGTGESITLNMIKGGVITGKVVTADNDPVVAVRVRALRIRDLNGRRPARLELSPDRLTDDRGIYRIFGLLPGTYLVYAGGRGYSGTGANAYDNDVPTFAPSSTRDTAEEVSLGSGEERTMDIRYRGISGHTVSGTVKLAISPNSPWIQVNLSRIVNSKVDIGTSTFERERANGFAFQGVADGEYVIWTGYTSRADELLISEPKRIIVKGADVTGIELFAKPLASVAGTVVLEPSTIAECKDKRRPLFEETLVSLKRTQKQLPKPEPGRDQELELPIYASSRAAADGAGNFQLRSLAAGQYSFNLRVSAKYWYLRSVTLPGTAKDAITVDVARNLLTLKSGDRLSGLKAMLAEGAASISGQVELPEDRRGGSIVVYAVPAEKDDVLRYFAAPVADDGSFALDHVPPGRYWTVAKPVAAESEMDTSKLRLPSEAATRAKLKREAEAAKSDVELKPCQSMRNHQLPITSN